VPSGSSAVGAAAVPSAVTDAVGASGSVVGGHVAALLPGSIHEHVVIPSPTIGVSPGVSGWSTEKMLAELLGRYDSFDCASLSRVESMLTSHLRATRPSEISFAFKNGVNRRYVLATAVGTGPVRSRQMQRRLKKVATIIQGVTTADLSAHQAPLLKLLEAARVGKGVAVVPVGGFLRLSPREQAQFAVRHQLSAETVSQLRQAGGGNASEWASREVFRSAMSALSHEPGRQVWSDDRGAHLVSLRAALESLFEDLSSSGQFRERLVRGLDGLPVHLTKAFRPCPELPYEQHCDSTADVPVCVSLDKGGRGTATSKLVLTTPNQERPIARANSIVLSTLPCVDDSNEELHKMIGPWAGDLQEILDHGLFVGGTLRAVRLLLGGDLAFLSAFLGHKCASARCSCPWCPVVARSREANEALALEYGSIQAVDVAPTQLRTRKQMKDAILAYETGPNASLPIPRTLSEHLSIESCPLFDIYLCQIVTAPLHLTLGVTPVLLRLGIESTYAALGRASSVAAATAIGRALLDEVRVRPVAYHGGGFEGRASHRIAERSHVVCDALAPYLPANQLKALRGAWVTWAALAKTLNPAQDVSVEEAAAFEVGSLGMCPPLQAAFPWLSITPKLHALAHQAPAFLRRFCSLGSYGEQALEAWHGWFNHTQAQCTADSFLGTFLKFVQRAVLELQPSADVALDNGQHRRPAAAGTRKATKPSDGHLRKNKEGPRHTKVGREKEIAQMEAWARGRAVAAGVKIDAYKKKQQPQVARPHPAAEGEVIFVDGTDGSGLAAQMKETSGDGKDEYLEKEELDPAVGLMLG